MFKRIIDSGRMMWRWFCGRSLFVRMLLIVPIGCAVLMTVFIGNMGLALMGFAFALYAPVVGSVTGFIAVVFGKAVQIIWKDWKRTSQSK